MGIDLSRLRRGNDHDRRPWHGAAFIVEALVLLVFLIASLAVIMQVIAGAHERSIEADRLSNAIILASNDAEAFAADPTSGNTGGEYVLVDGQLVQPEGPIDVLDKSVYDLTRIVEAQSQPGGTLYTAHIYVSCGGEATYQIDTARYVSNEGGAAMNSTNGSVRIGPISLFTLVIILCLAVMAVLSATTAQATYSAAEKQALFTNDTYQNEQAAQSAVAVIDAALEDVRASGGGLDEALAAVDEALPADAQRDGSRVLMTFASSSGRTLDVELTITANATYEISQWKATTQWTNDGPGATLWSGAAQTR